MVWHVDLYWSFRSPYSYLVTGRMAALAQREGVHVSVRIVYPLAIRDPEFFQHSDPRWLTYTLKDVARLSQYLDIPIAPPKPDPIVQNMATREIAAEQPHIHRLTRLGLAAEEAGQGMAFIDVVSKLIWSGAVQGWDQGDHLAEAAVRAGLDFSALEQMVQDEPKRLDKIAADNVATLDKSGHWGVPTMVFKGEPFFRQDRFDLLVWRLEQDGLPPTQSRLGS